VIFQIDFACEKNEKKKHHDRVKKKTNRQSSDSEQQRTNRDVRCDQIFFFEEEVFVVFKHRDHVSRNEQLHNTRIAEQTIIFTEIECSNLLVHNASTQRQRSSSDQQSRNQ
jgi:hypothetical protein